MRAVITLVLFALLVHTVAAVQQISCATTEDHSPVYEPVQVHLSIGRKEDEMTVMWNTKAATPTSAVKYFLGPCSTAEGSRTWAIALGQSVLHEGSSIHRSRMGSLQADSQYCYAVGDPCKGWSKEFEFRTPSLKKVSFAALADTGTWGNVTVVLPRLTADKDATLVLHAGDLSYAQTEEVWDTWGNLVEPVSRTHPYMVIPGNWDVKPFAVRSFLTRYHMPLVAPSSEKKISYYYSFQYSMVHIVMMSSYDPYEVDSEQYNWLVKDLEAADEDRSYHPWIVVCFHSPMYSSSEGHGGGDEKFRQAIEPLLFKYRVDLAITGHDHGYERSYPVYDKEPHRVHKSHYVDPPSTIHVLAGTGGATTDPWLPLPTWTARRESSYGYTKVTATYDTMHVEYVRADGTIGDAFRIVKVSGTTISINHTLALSVLLTITVFFVLLYKGAFRRITTRFAMSKEPLLTTAGASPLRVYKHV